MDWTQAFKSTSFGHAYLGEYNVVSRYGTVICRADEIIDGWPEEDA